MMQHDGVVVKTRKAALEELQSTGFLHPRIDALVQKITTYIKLAAFSSCCIVAPLTSI
jgi:hypothetical protein